MLVRRGHDGGEGVPPHLEGRAAGAAAGPDRRPRRRTGSSARPTSRPASSWDELPGDATSRRSPRPRPSGRRGTWCRPITSGCATSRSRRCWSTCSSGSTRRSRTPSRISRASSSSSSAALRLTVRPRLVSRARSIGHNGDSMDVESRDSVSLKPAELDELGQLVSGVGLPLHDEQLDRHVEQFPLVAVAADDGEIAGLPVRLARAHRRHARASCGASARCAGARQARPSLDGLVAELYRRAAISFPDEDVLVAGRIAHPAAYTLLGVLDDVCPARSTRPTARSGPGAGASPGASAATPATTTARFRLQRPRRARAGARRPRRSRPAARSSVELVGEVDPASGEAMIAYGWAMAEALADGLSSH